jgi:hypothetical protein
MGSTKGSSGAAPTRYRVVQRLSTVSQQRPLVTVGFSFDDELEHGDRLEVRDSGLRTRNSRIDVGFRHATCSY